MVAVAQRATDLLGMSADLFSHLPLTVGVQRLAAMAAGPERVEEMIEYNQLINDIRSQRFETVLPFVERWGDGDRHLAERVGYAWMSSLTEQVVKTNGHLENFDRVTHDEAVETFRELGNGSPIIGFDWLTPIVKGTAICMRGGSVRF